MTVTTRGSGFEERFLACQDLGPDLDQKPELHASKPYMVTLDACLLSIYKAYIWEFPPSGL